MPMRVRMQVYWGFVKGLVTYPVWGLRVRRQRARFDPSETHLIVVEPGPDGRPGERLLAPAPRLWKTKMIPGARHDFQLHLDESGSHLTGLCLGSVAEHGAPGSSARKTVEHFWAKGWVSLTPIVVEQVAGEEAYRYRLASGRAQLTEWKFSHRGWLYVVGAFNRAQDEDATVARAREVLDTWEWLD
jgi:hypothetical protein